MRLDLIPKLRCAVCDQGSLEVESFLRMGELLQDGVLICSQCKYWYPVDDYLLELLPPELGSEIDRKNFFEKHRLKFETMGVPYSKPDHVKNQKADIRFQIEQQEHFDEFAGSGNTISYHHFEKLPFWEAFDANVFGAWKPKIGEGAWVLDVGCANGRSAFKLADLNVHVVGFDISSKLVRQAIDRAKEMKLLSKMTFFVGDASHFPFVDATFDNVVIYAVLHHLPEPATSLKEASRVLRSGGLYFGNENNKTPLRTFFDLLMKINPLWIEKGGKEPLIGKEDMSDWAKKTELDLSMYSAVFVPPHFCNLIGINRSKKILKLTDWFCRLVPGFKHCGGILLIEGKKRSV